MSGKSLNGIIARATEKVGKIAGFPFKLFRASGLDFIDPLQDKNLIGVYQMTFSEDKEFEKNPEDTMGFFKLYMNYLVLNVFDILYNESLDRTFVVTEIDPLRGAVGLQCTARMDILRPVSTPTLDFKTSFEAKATNIPCVFTNSSPHMNKGVLKEYHSSSIAGQTIINLWTSLPDHLLVVNDVCVIDGNKFVVDSFTGTHKGTFVTARSMKAGK